MLHTRSEGRPVEESAPKPRGAGLTDFLLDVLESAESYEAHILQAEKDGDPELAAFLRGLRRQDVGRAREAVRLLRRPPEARG